MPRGEKYPEEIREEARRLRRLGWSLGEIAKQLGPPKNTLTVWLRGIELSPEQRKRLYLREAEANGRNRALGSDAHRKGRLKRIQQQQERAEAFLSGLENMHQINHIAAAMLYLGEGAKGEGAFAFANSNPQIVQYWMYLMRASFQVDETKFNIQILSRYDQDWDQLFAYWKNITGIQRATRSIPDPRTVGKPTKRKNYMGVCRINYYDVSLRRYLDALAHGLIARAAGAAPQGAAA